MKKLFEEFGIVMRLKNPGKGGFPLLSWTEKKEGLFVKGTMLVTNPLYESGLEKGDQVLEIDGESIKTSSDFDRDWELETIHSIKYLQNGLIYTGNFTIKQDSAYELLLSEVSGKTPSPDQLEKRISWLNQ